MIKKCIICKKEFKTFPCRVGKYCSYSCNNKMKPGTFAKGHKWVGRLRSNGIYTTKDGSIYVLSINHPFKDCRNYVLKQRLVMEKHLKRFLKPTEIVRHKNGIKSDNRVENLIIFQSKLDPKLSELSHNWKGAKVGYRALHSWVTKRFPKTLQCNKCKIKPPIDLANISQKYKRDLNDWEWLRRRCHQIKDGRLERLKIIGSNTLRRYRKNKDK